MATAQEAADRLKRHMAVTRLQKAMEAAKPQETDAGIFAGSPFAASVPGGDPTRGGNVERAADVDKARAVNTLRQETRVGELSDTLKENAPAIGATVATLPFMGPGAGVAGPAAARTIPKLGQALLNIGKHPGRLALGAGRAGVGGAAGGALAAEEGQTIDEALQGFKEQASADTLSRFALGAGKFLLKPAGKLGAEVLRLIDFARKEGLHLDPGLATEKLAPKIVSSFIKGFFGSRPVSQKQLMKIGRHMTSDPKDAQAFFKTIIGDMPPDALSKLNARNIVSMEALAKRSTNATIQSAAKKGAGESIEVLFSDPRAAGLARRMLPRGEYQGLMQAHVQNMIQRSSRSAGQAGVVIDGNLLKAELDTFGDIIRRELPGGRGVVERLEGLAAYAKAHAEVPAASVETFLTPQSGVQTGIIAGVGSMLDPTTVGGLTAALSSALSLQMFNPRSKVGKWLTTGLFQGPLSKAAGVVVNEQVRNTLGPVTAAGVDLVK